MTPPQVPFFFDTPKSFVAQPESMKCGKTVDEGSAMACSWRNTSKPDDPLTLVFENINLDIRESLKRYCLSSKDKIKTLIIDSYLERQ